MGAARRRASPRPGRPPPASIAQCTREHKKLPATLGGGAGGRRRGRESGMAPSA